MVKQKFISAVSRNWRVKSAVILLVLLGFGAGIGATLFQSQRSTEQLRQQYDLLSRRILLDDPNDVILDFRSLQSEYEQYIKSRGLENSVSLNFEYLPTGSSIGIKEDREQLAASLLKLPLVINFYHAVEQGQLSLDTKVALKKEWLNSSYGELNQKGEGFTLTYRDAIGYALRQSDNTAALMIFDAVSQAQGTDRPKLLAFVDANYAETPTAEVVIGVQSYSSILKCLYFSCYLTKDHSQEVLKYLSESETNKRLTLFTPSSLPVAHKIGTYQSANQSDCGIFYVPKRNYILCVMVQQPDPEASRIIADLSLMTYDYMKVPPKDENQ